MLIDTHSHIYVEEFDNDRDAVVERARAAGVGTLMFPAIDRQSYDRMFAAVERYGADYCRPMMGLHPTSVTAAWEADVEHVERYFQTPPVTRFWGVGEIGLDFYWSQEFREEQIAAFRRQVELALRLELPIAVHTRAAWPQMLEIIAQYAGRGLRGIFHAFSENAETWRTLSQYGDFRCGIGGVVTYRKSTVAEAVREIPLEAIVLETDCPYLTPVPHRGERNESAYITYTRDCVAALKGVSADEVERVTTTAARTLFGF